MFKEGRNAKFGCKSNLKGVSFNYLVPLELVDGIVDGGYVWKCKCICGSYKVVPARYLLRGDVKSCGCLKKKQIRERCWKGFGEIGKDYWSSIKDSAKSRGVGFSISIDFAWILFLKQDRQCALTSKPLYFSSRSSGYGNASLDRIDNSLGYTPENVQWVHKDINVLKNKYSESYLLNLCEKVYLTSTSNFNFEPLILELDDDFLIEKYSYSQKGLKISKAKWSGVGEVNSDYYSSLKRNALIRDLDFEISIEDIWNLYLKQGGRCFLSGLKISFSRNRKRVEQTASVDRIDSNLGYTKDNIQIIHKDINIMKHNYPQFKFVEYAELIYKNKDKDKFPKKVIALSGGWDPPHKGHYSMFQDAGNNFPIVVGILNSDDWLFRKKGYQFMEFEERKYILERCKDIDLIVSVDDSDNSVCEAIKRIRPDYFGNGGDRKSDNVPEVELCKNLNIEMIWNIGGGKIQSSSELVDRLNKIKNEKSEV